MSSNEMIHSFNEYIPKCMKFSYKNMDGYIQEQNINNEISIVKTGFNVKDDVTLEYSNINGLILGYNLAGYSEHKNINTGSHTKTANNESNMFIAKNESQISYIAKGTLNNIGIIVKKEFIEKNISDNIIKDLVLSSLDKDSCEKLIFHKKTDSYKKLILNDIYKLPFDESLNNIYIQSKVLELLFIELNSLADDKKSIKNSIKLDEYDIEAIKKARDILLANMQNPPSIVELAKMVRINDFKLKKGFKEVFQTTPYNLLLDYRLEYAKKLLIESNLNINEIAQKVGYKYTASFSAAFIKKYGVMPKSIMRNKKYYYL